MIGLRFRLRVGALSAAALMMSASFSFASETLTTSSSGYTGPVIDLGAFKDGSYNYTFGPKQLPDGIVFNANPGGGGVSGDGSVIGQGKYGLVANGSLDIRATYIGVDSGTGYDTLTFSKAVSSFGAYWNYAPGFGADATITTFDGMNEIASFDLVQLAPISTPGGVNQFVFRGITDTSAEITSVQFGGNYLVLSGSQSGAIAGGVPEVSTWAMMLLGFAGLGFAGYRSQRKAAIQA
jgi:hypothetical protein